MSTLFKEGRLTIRMCLYLDAFLITAVMAFSLPITLTYFYGVISAELVAAAAILFKIVGIVMSFIKQSKLMIRWIAANFIPAVIVIDSIFFVLAIIGADFPEIRYIGYNLICIIGVKLLQIVRKDNTANCLKGTTIVTFSAKCETIGLIGGLLGGAISVVALSMTDIPVTVAMLIENFFCAIAHWMQAFANKRIHELGLVPVEKVTFLVALEDSLTMHKKKTAIKEEDDTVFDQ